MRDLNVIIRQDMKKHNYITDNASWFRNDPHRWTTASLPLAYATACVEVVSKSSEKAASLYKQILEAWDNPGVTKISKEIYAEIPDSTQEEIKQTLINPEKALLPDPNKPFKDLEEVFTDLKMDDAILNAQNSTETISKEDEKNLEEVLNFALLIYEFILVGFNREADVDKGIIKVIPSEKHIWLILAVEMRTSFEHANIKLEKVRNFYLVRKNKGKIIDYHKILTEQPMSRMHRRMIADSKKVNLKLKNDRIFMNAARLWHQCRVVYPSVNKYCEAQSAHGEQLDPKNIEKMIKPCDEAV
jgi:hypothetical protein